MSIIDMHVHTKYSACSNIEIHDLLSRISLLNIDGIVITDHDEIKGAKIAQKYAKEKYDVKVFFGIEVTTLDGHLLAYGINEKLSVGMRAVDTIKEIQKKGGVAVAPHPFRNAFTSLGDMIYTLGNTLDGIEINAMDSRTAKDQARSAAQQLNLAIIGGSDAHSLKCVGRSVTKFETDIESMDDFVNAIRKRHCQPYSYF
ncbi:MAG: PHP-associated domain-containing protein [Promethearchaeota archaeon]